MITGTLADSGTRARSGGSPAEAVDRAMCGEGAPSPIYEGEDGVIAWLLSGPRIGDPGKVERIVIHTSHHTHYVIGLGSGDPQKYDPTASRRAWTTRSLHLRRRVAGRDLVPSCYR
ncbi:hypothetical protein [Amycolatopsis pigmentata]|uniref:Uncharacterized protein n=1 Tax=Amycolatopsis pigmentata TaxID=450801 RepID=A0ABW5FXJ1_9PSEU